MLSTTTFQNFEQNPSFLCCPTISSQFGQRVKQLRKQRQWTQYDMARRFGLNRSFISDLERGRKSASIHTLQVISVGMKISLSELVLDL